MQRFFQHLFFPPWRARQWFPPPVLDAIEREVGAAERDQGSELRVAIEAHLGLADLLRGTSPRARAATLFSRLGVWDTEHNTGVLIYLLLAERRVEILADRGIAAQVPPDFWTQVCERMTAAFRQGEFESGLGQGIREIAGELGARFPLRGTNPNELPDRPLVL